MHTLEHALFTLSIATEDEKIAGLLLALAGASHDYLPPKIEEHDISADLVEEIRKLPARR